jgi:hypothetical protein
MYMYQMWEEMEGDEEMTEHKKYYDMYDDQYLELEYGEDTLSFHPDNSKGIVTLDRVESEILLQELVSWCDIPYKVDQEQPPTQEPSSGMTAQELAGIMKAILTCPIESNIDKLALLLKITEQVLPEEV